MLENIRIVLVRPFHPGNIGSSARAMKTMGLSSLYLVNPRQFPDEEANKMAAGAEDVLESAVICESILDALADCRMVIASTARVRGYDLPRLSPEECGGVLLQNAGDGPVALLFGPERFGISNSDLEFARARVTIPANPEYSSLNLAASVQTLCYEIYKQHSVAESAEKTIDPFIQPSVQELEYFYQHLEETFRASGFINRKHPGEIMQKLRRLFGKAQLNSTEVNILRGMLASISNSKNQR